MNRKKIEIKISEDDRLRILANLVIDKILEMNQNKSKVSIKGLILSQSNK